VTLTVSSGTIAYLSNKEAPYSLFKEKTTELSRCHIALKIITNKM